MDIEVEFTGGGSYPLPVNAATTDQLLITGPAWLRSYSLRDVQANAPVQASGSVVAPAAGATIAVTAALPAGTYSVSWTVGLQGAAAAADANNFELVHGATVVLVSVNPGAAGEYAQVQAEFTVAQGDTIAIKAVGAGTAAVTYSGDLNATPTGEIETIVELQDGSKPVAEISFRSERTQNGDYGKPGVCIETALNLHVIQGTVSGAVHVAYEKP